MQRLRRSSPLGAVIRRTHTGLEHQHEARTVEEE
jgi:hypothetical protein